MQCPQKELDAVGKQASGANVQPFALQDKETKFCHISSLDGHKGHKFNINQCESHIKSDLDTVSLSIDQGTQGN